MSSSGKHDATATVAEGRISTGMKGHTRYRRTGLQRLVLLLNVVMIATSLFLVTALSYGHIRTSSVNRIALENQLAKPTGKVGSRVLNILLVGSDSAANLDPDDPVRKNRRGERLGDVVIIAHLDERTGQAALLSLPRDLWIPVGGSRGSARINTTFAVGGPAKLIKTIEENFAVPIHHYVNVDFAGFKGLVEAVGSVEVFFPTPARDWNSGASPPRSQTGFEVAEAGCIALEPDQALAYVRSRYYQTQDEDGDWVTDPSSDLGRIQRQQEFLTRLLTRSIEMGARNPVVLRDLVDAGLANVTIDQDLTPQTLLDLGRTFNNFEPTNLKTYSLPVTEASVGDGDVLIPIESRLDPVLRLFAGNRFDEQSTIGVQIDVGKNNDQLASQLYKQLNLAGYDVQSRRPKNRSSDGESDTDSQVQLVLKHGSSDKSTAETVAATLQPEAASPILLEEDLFQPARTVGVLLQDTADQEGNSQQKSSEDAEASPNPELGFGEDAEGNDDDTSTGSEDSQNCG